MMIDQVKIRVQSGDGGDGLVAFRREKYVPHGGPAGGDGGHGGDVVLKVQPGMNTLARFVKQVHFKAKPGGRGGSSNKTGASSPPLIVEVPAGTVVRDAETGAILADLVEDAQEAIVVHGGRGGRGNA
ncbi:MAG: GTPase ObgE, partial [Chloroflexi bacterium]|nr:GTPase ObgE [Chloroflexota bacterium]